MDLRRVLTVFYGWVYVDNTNLNLVIVRCHKALSPPNLEQRTTFRICQLNVQQRTELDAQMSQMSHPPTCQYDPIRQHKKLLRVKKMSTLWHLESHPRRRPRGLVCKGKDISEHTNQKCHVFTIWTCKRRKIFSSTLSWQVSFVHNLVNLRTGVGTNMHEPHRQTNTITHAHAQNIS